MQRIKQRIVKRVRELTPLRLRRSLGPFIGYLNYLFNIYFIGADSKIKVLSIDDTIDLINKDTLSVIRFGDGEISLIDNVDLGFQVKNDTLAIKLKEILGSNINSLLICVPGVFGRIDNFTKASFWFAIHHLFRYRNLWESLLSSRQVYGNAFITRPYLTFTNKDQSQYIFKKIFSIWEGKDIVLIEGEKSRLGVGNNMFDNVK